MFSTLNVLFLGVLFSRCLPYLRAQEPKVCYNRFEYEYNVLQKMVKLEEKVSKQEEIIDSLHKQYKDTEAAFDTLQRIVQATHDTTDGSAYIRWGRTSCPDGGSFVYHGYAAGSYYTHPGSGSNWLCLPTDPMWKEYTDGGQSTGLLYGSEYQVSEHPFLKHLHDENVPCVICRIPRSIVLMIPGRYECYENFTLEYSGYLMSGYHDRASSLDYVCVDGEPEALKGGNADEDGALFYLVESECGSLSCPPYKQGREITCAVCSYSPS